MNECQRESIVTARPNAMGQLVISVVVLCALLLILSSTLGGVFFLNEELSMYAKGHSVKYSRDCRTKLYTSRGRSMCMN